MKKKKVSKTYIRKIYSWIKKLIRNFVLRTPIQGVKIINYMNSYSN